MSNTNAFPDWQEKIKLLANSAWKDAEINDVKIDHWLSDFNGATGDSSMEQRHAFHLLTQFMYVGRNEIQECLRVLFQEKYVYPFVQRHISSGNPLATLRQALNSQLLEKTRFVGVGNPSESGPSFLYSFRMANDLSTVSFTSIEQVAIVMQPSNASVASVTLNPTTLDHLIFLDDFCATGEQVQRLLLPKLTPIKMAHPHLRITYLLLFATRIGLNNLSNSNLFNDVEAAIVFDDDYKAFSINSHYYNTATAGIDKLTAENVMRTYSQRLGFSGSDILGFGDSQLLVGFAHNTPDNTLPVFWRRSAAPPWHPPFPRSEKH